MSGNDHAHGGTFRVVKLKIMNEESIAQCTL